MATPPDLRSAEKTESIQKSVAFTKSDTDSASTNFPSVSRAIWVGTAGDVAVVYLDDSVTVHKNMAAGQWHPFKAKRINSTSTTATDLVVGW